MKKNVKFDFFKIRTPNITSLIKNFEDSLENGCSKPVKYYDQYVRVESCSTYSAMGPTLKIGTTTKLRIDELPFLATISQPGLTELDLEDDEALANISAYAICPDFEILVLQRSFNGVRAGSYVHLIASITGIDEIELLPMIDADIINKLSRMQIISKFIMRVANPTSPDSYNELSVDQAANLASHYDANTVKIELGIGNNRKIFMNAGRIIDTAKSLLNKNDNNQLRVESLIIRGKEFDDKKMSTLDLITKRLFYSEDIELTNRIIARDNLENAVLRAFSEKLTILKDYTPLV
jgi:hypothetical protein